MLVIVNRQFQNINHNDNNNFFILNIWKNEQINLNNCIILTLDKSFRYTKTVWRLKKINHRTVIVYKFGLLSFLTRSLLIRSIKVFKINFNQCLFSNQTSVNENLLQLNFSVFFSTKILFSFNKKFLLTIILC